ncbi:MAG: TonB family protein [Flavobacteriales bacterium]
MMFHLYLFIWAGLLWGLQNRIDYTYRKPLIFGGILFIGLISQINYSLPASMVLVTLPEVRLAASDTQTSSSIPWFFVVWAIGAVSSFLILLGKLNVVYSIKKRSVSKGDGCFELSTKDSSLGAFSFWNWIFIPKCEDSEMLECMLVHEQVHRKEKHSIERFIMEVLKLLFWFNPAVYLLDQTLKQFHERQADAVSLTTLNRDQYVNALLSSSFGLKSIQGFVQPFSSKKHIKTRINMIYKPKMGFAAIGLMVAAAGMLLIAQGCSKRAGETETRHKVEGSADVQAVYPGGNEAMFEHIFANLKYPKDEASEGIEGMVVVGFIVEANGEVSNAEVKKGLGEAFDNAAIEVVESFPKWTPSMKDGAAVATELTLPIKFVLED